MENIIEVLLWPLKQVANRQKLLDCCVLIFSALEQYSQLESIDKTSDIEPCLRNIGCVFRENVPAPQPATEDLEMICGDGRQTNRLQIFRIVLSEVT